MNKDSIYHQIALACLRTLKSDNNVNKEEQIVNLYQAIDQAFQEQTALVLAELSQAEARLKSISDLSPEHHDLADAQTIARAQQIAH